MGRLLKSGLLFALAFCVCSGMARAQGHEDEIVANLAGGRVIVHVARDLIVFAAIDQPLEVHSIPPRVMNLDSTHVGILFGAAEWQLPAEPKPVRLDHNFQRINKKNPQYQSEPNQIDPDLETIGIAFLEKLRPLVTQLHHKLEFSPEDPFLEIIIIGYAPDNYGPEIWQVDYRMEQEAIATRGDYWQTHVLRPRFVQLYPPEGKHSPRTLVEIPFPATAKGPTLAELIHGNDPRLLRLRSGEPRFAKVLENIEKGQAQKAAPLDSVDFMRAALPLIAGDKRFVMATLAEQQGFDWIVPPEEPIEKNTEQNDGPPQAPSLRRKPKP